MVDKWENVPIDAIKAKHEGAIAIGPFGSSMKADRYVSSGVPVIRGNNISDTRSLDEDFVFVSEATADELSRCNVFPDDLIFPHRGAIGRVGIVPRGAPARYVLSTSLMKLTCDREKADPMFLFYFFRSSQGRNELLKNASTVGTPGIGQPLSSLRAIAVSLPPIEEQNQIGKILGALDDKIDLNRKKNATLEAIAQALFKSWFVDFDPVRAKAEGRDTLLPKQVVDLFPSNLVGSECGEIPDGWHVGSVLSQARLLSGGTPKTANSAYWDGAIPWASAKDVSQSGQTFLVATERSITGRGLEESATQMIPALSTVIVARGATTGRMVLLGREMAMNQTCYALATSTGTPFALYCQVAQAIDGLVHAAHGSVFDTVTTSTFAGSKIVVAPPSVVSSFEEKISAAFMRILNGIQESATLVALRDALLPKLISGQIRVKQAEKLVEAAL